MKWISENDANTKFFHFKSSRTSRPNVGNLKFNQLVLELLAEKKKIKNKHVHAIEPAVWRNHRFTGFSSF
jgi:hypothetical protein